MFKALLLTQNAPRETTAELVDLEESRLPQGAVRVAVSHSTVNYKDALAITGRSPVVRQFPMVPGIDFAGSVLDSDDERFQRGDAVILNGWGVGESHWGGLAQQARVSADWLIHQPAAFSAQDAMSIGTAGYTAMLCVMALEEKGVTPAAGPVLVTGANGGVGSIAVALLAGRGFEVHASTGRTTEAAHLKALGATEIVDRSTLDAPGKPLQKERWAAAVDSVGSHTLVNVCASLRYGGSVAACGLAQGMDLPGSVAPFILRGISLLGIDSVNAPLQRRQEAWQRLALELPREVLTRNTQVVGLGEVVALAGPLLAGQIRGRVVVDVNR